MTAGAESEWFGPASVPSAAISFGMVALLLVTRLGAFGVIPLLFVGIVAAALAYFPGWRRHTGIGLLTGFAAMPIGLAVYVPLAVAAS